jgi:hypothetical protein
VLLAVAAAMYFSCSREKERSTAAPAVSIKKELPEARMELIKAFPFSEKNSLKEWEEKIFRGEVIYLIEQGDDLSYVRAKSKDAASAMYYKIKIDAKTGRRPLVAWKWKVEKFPLKKNPETLEAENEDDFAARVYVIFPAGFILNSKVLEYVWAETLPVGSTGTSPYSKNIKLMVLEAGPVNDGWRTESRDILADYQKMFGASPERDIGIIGFMTNTEHTGTTANAMYDEIKIGYKEGSGTGRGKK